MVKTGASFFFVSSLIINHCPSLSFRNFSMAGEYIEAQHLAMVNYDNAKFKETFEIDLTNPSKLDRFMTDKSKSALLTKPNVHSILQNEYQQLLKDRNYLRTEKVLKIGETKVFLPVNLGRVIQNVSKKLKIRSESKSDLDATWIVEEIQKLCKKLEVVRGTDRISKEAQTNATLLFCMMLRSTFSSKRVLSEHRLDKTAFNELIGEIETRFNHSIAYPGEMVGPLAAQSIGEPATQMTLSMQPRVFTFYCD